MDIDGYITYCDPMYCIPAYDPSISQRGTSTPYRGEPACWAASNLSLTDCAFSVHVPVDLPFTGCVIKRSMTTYSVSWFVNECDYSISSLVVQVKKKQRSTITIFNAVIHNFANLHR